MCARAIISVRDWIFYVRSSLRSRSTHDVTERRFAMSGRHRSRTLANPRTALAAVVVLCGAMIWTAAELVGPAGGDASIGGQSAPANPASNAAAPAEQPALASAGSLTSSGQPVDVVPPTSAEATTPDAAAPPLPEIPEFYPAAVVVETPTSTTASVPIPTTYASPTEEPDRKSTRLNSSHRP